MKADNQLTGTIPTEIGLLTSLTGLYLVYNDLTGNIPSEIGLLKNLKYLKTYRNNLNDTIPSEVQELDDNNGLTFSNW
eukprot:CAMPEP_0116095296 /NCGR_PEP_ID=MMETSP0327-20121206/9587_1 /TAXON_ID=44447 /ORGANISM="Pseudo-nitzschia delicatissima, Strain B596" /LENGTH=77 /DNA_ID=CAMNT_0003586953 /DNA_START=339 /DNA_END=572 /DNA_ORIENTATION=-